MHGIMEKGEEVEMKGNKSRHAVNRKKEGKRHKTNEEGGVNRANQGHQTGKEG